MIKMFSSQGICENYGAHVYKHFFIVSGIKNSIYFLNDADGNDMLFVATCIFTQNLKKTFPLSLRLHTLLCSLFSFYS